MKVYEKPDLYYEDFELSTHVATCAWDMTNQSDKDSCSAESDKDILGSSGLIIFLESNDKCEINDYEDYCWTNGGDSMNVFNS